MSGISAVPYFSKAFSPIETLINKEFPSGDVALNVLTTTSNGLQIIADGSKSNLDGAIKSSLGFSYISKAHGVSLQSVWRQANEADFSLLINNAFLSGASVDISSTLTDSKVPSCASLGINYLAPNCAMASKYFLTAASSRISADVVLGKTGFVVGGSLLYDTSDARLVSKSFMGGFMSPEYTLLFKWHSLHSQFALMGLHRVSQRFEIGWKGCNSGLKSENNHFEVGAKYLLDPTTAVKGKVDNDGRMSVGMSILVNEYLKVTLGANIDTKSFEGNNHKLGAAFNLKM